jgi:hypothetical protein
LPFAITSTSCSFLSASKAIINQSFNGSLSHQSKCLQDQLSSYHDCLFTRDFFSSYPIKHLIDRELTKRYQPLTSDSKLKDIFHFGRQKGQTVIGSSETRQLKSVIGSIVKRGT